MGGAVADPQMDADGRRIEKQEDPQLESFNYLLMLRSTWPVVGFRPDSRCRGRFETAPYPGA